ncbi:DUF378 domain-containing protein [Candidatus Uhrbacteria bacterium]|nr:DUF378 domain-containing protein [Candidatus Uhrbacteria bacterium]
MKGTSCKACTICTWILIIAGIHIGLLGIFQFDLLATFAVDSQLLLRIMYTIVGIAAVCIAAKTLGYCKMCKMGCKGDCK